MQRAKEMMGEDDTPTPDSDTDSSWGGGDDDADCEACEVFPMGKDEDWAAAKVLLTPVAGSEAVKVLSSTAGAATKEGSVELMRREQPSHIKSL